LISPQCTNVLSTNCSQPIDPDLACGIRERVEQDPSHHAGQRRRTEEESRSQMASFLQDPSQACEAQRARTSKHVNIRFMMNSGEWEILWPHTRVHARTHMLQYCTPQNKNVRLSYAHHSRSLSVTLIRTLVLIEGATRAEKDYSPVKGFLFIACVCVFRRKYTI